MATVVVTVNNQKIGARSVSPKSRSHVDLPYGSVRRPTVRVIRVGGGGGLVQVGTQMKYLGFTLNRCWSFAVHFGRLVEAAANALGRLLPRFGGPNGRM